MTPAMVPDCCSKSHRIPPDSNIGLQRYTDLTELNIARAHAMNRKNNDLDQATQCNAKQSIDLSSLECRHVAPDALAAYQQGLLAVLCLYNDVVARVIVSPTLSR